MSGESRESDNTHSSTEARGADWRPLGALLLIALLLKGAVLVTALSKDPLFSPPTSDALYYLTRAQGILGVIDDPLANQTYHLPPLYPFILAAIPGVSTGHLVGVAFVQALAGTRALYGVYLLARRRISSQGALLAAALSLAYGPLTFFEMKLLGDSIAYDLLIAGLLAADYLFLRPSPVRAGVMGVLFSLAALLRPQFLLLLPVLAVWLGLKDRHLAIGFLVAAALVIAPFTAHNMSTSGEFIPISDNGGVNLWLANGKDAPMTGTFETKNPSFGDIATQSEAARMVAKGHGLTELSPGTVSTHLGTLAFNDIAAAPLTFLHRVFLRGRALLESFQTGIVAVPEVEKQVLTPLPLLAIPFGLLAGLALASWIIGGRLRCPPVFPSYAVIGVVIFTTLLFFHYERFRLPLVPLLAIQVGAGWDAWNKNRPPTKKWLLACVLGLGVTWISFLPAPHHDLARANGFTSLGSARLEKALLARGSNSPGEYQRLANQALNEAQIALQHQPGFTRADLLAVRACLTLGRYEEADAHLTKIEAANPQYPPAVGLRALLEKRLATLPDR